MLYSYQIIIIGDYMSEYKRTLADKLRLLFHKDERVTQGGVYSVVREFDFSSYCPVDSYIKPAVPPDHNVYDIRDFGAVAGVETFDCAPAINAAIDAAEKSGGTVLVKGGDFTSSAVYLKSGITLFIEKNASVSAFKNGKGYPRRSLVYGEDLNNITITGGGMLNGNGNYFGREPIFAQNMTAPREYVDVVQMRSDYRKQLRFAHESKYGSVIVLKNCTNVKADNFMIENSAYWTFRLDKCSGVEIRDLVINNNRNVANADGIDMVGTSDVVIDHCFISTADDGIVIKNAVWEGCDAPMRNIHIKNCEIISRTNSIKVGTETTHDISNIKIENCRLFMTDLYPGTVSAIALEAVDGAKLYDVHIQNIECERCSCPLFIRLGNRNRAAKVNAQSARAIEFGKRAQKGGTADKRAFDFKSEIFDITVEDLKAREAEIPVMICGFRQRGRTKRVRNVLLKNINIEMTKRPFISDKRLFIPEYAAEYPEANRFRNLPSYALFIRHARNVKTENFKCIPAVKGRKMTYIKDLK